MYKIKHAVCPDQKEQKKINRYYRVSCELAKKNVYLLILFFIFYANAASKKQFFKSLNEHQWDD